MTVTPCPNHCNNMMIMNLIFLQPHMFAAKMAPNEMLYLKATERNALTGQALIFNFKIFLAIWEWLYTVSSIIHTSISKIYPKFQVLSFRFPEVKMSKVSYLMSLEQQLWKEKMSQLQSIPIVTKYMTKVLLPIIPVYLVLFWYSIFEVKKWQSCMQKFSSRLQDLTAHILFWAVYWYEHIWFSV